MIQAFVRCHSHGHTRTHKHTFVSAIPKQEYIARSSNKHKLSTEENNTYYFGAHARFSLKLYSDMLKVSNPKDFKIFLDIMVELFKQNFFEMGRIFQMTVTACYYQDKNMVERLLIVLVTLVKIKV